MENMVGDKSYPKVSVIIPTFNRRDLIAETIKSVLTQTFKDFEIIVVDNGGTDDTEKIIRKLNDPRIIYHWQEPTGRPAPPRNKGLNMARGEYVGFLDSDDLWFENKLELQLKKFEENPELKWVYCKVEEFDHDSGSTIKKLSDSSYYEGDISSKLIMDNFIASPSPLIKKTVLDQVGGFDENPVLLAREDWELWLRIASMFNIGFVPTVLAKYRVHKNSISLDKELMLKKYYGKIAAICSAASFAPEKYSNCYLKALERNTINYTKYFLLNNDKKVAYNVLNDFMCQRKRITFISLKLLVMLPTKLITILYHMLKSLRRKNKLGDGN